MTSLTAGAAIPHFFILLFTGLPPVEAWPWIACTVLVGVLAATLLASAYSRGDFTVAYPLVRGLIPVVLALAAIPLFGETLGAADSAGIAFVSSGLGLVAWESIRRSRTVTSRGLALAVLAALTTSLAALSDAAGARASPGALSYAATTTVLNSTAMAAFQARRRSLLEMLRRHWQIAVFGSILSNSSYLLYIWSLARAPVALVSALRETSMLFALAIAAVVLRERLTAWRVAAVLVIVSGVMLIRS